MYEPRISRLFRPLKKRARRCLTRPFAVRHFLFSQGWLVLVALSHVIIPPRVVPRLFTYIKKLVRYPQNRTRFWVNAQCAYLVTRKPLNVRMGKGKGAKVRLYSLINRQTAIAAVSRLRLGLQTRLKRFSTTRLGCPTFIATPNKGSTLVEWTQRHRIQTSFLRTRATEVKALLAFLRRPTIKIFFARLFRGAFRRPRLRWRFR